MGRRIDYYDDPNAPKANSLVPSVNVVVENYKGEILMIRRTDNDNWALPGGAIDIGESVTQAAIRETKEETGIDVEITGLVGIYSDPKHVIHYTSNNEVRQEFSIVLTARCLSGKIRVSDEARAVLWMRPREIEEQQMDDSMRKRLKDYNDTLSQPKVC
ncbi:NUDIX domain-containing protein [Actinomadura luteofluorescens]|uniref:NUDIX hydrolase n=1 Tax=Actinomadura luteofluorescens TaxID=46163 RepID=UPI0030D4B2B2